MANKYEIVTVFKLIDQITAPLNKVGKAGSVAGRQLKRDFMAAQDTVHNFGKTLMTAGKYAVMGGIAAIGAGIAIATKQYIDFDAAVQKSGALFQDLDPTKPEEFQAALKSIGDESRAVAAVTEYNAVDTAGAMQKMAMAGMSSKTAIELLRGTTDLAIAAGTDLTTAVDIATDALGAFGMEATGSNLTRLSDVFAKTASSFNTDLQPMFEAIKYAGPSFTAASQSVDTLAASIGVLANAGIKGSNAGTALNAIFTQLKSGAKREALEGLGVQVTDAEGNFVNLIDIVAQLEKKMAGMGSAQQGEILSGIFGVRGEKAMNLLLQTGAEKLYEYEDMIRQSNGASAQMADVMRGSIQNRIEILKSGLTELGFKFVEAFKDKGVNVLNRVIEAVENFDPTSIINGVAKVADIFMNLMNIVWSMKEIILGVTIAWGVYKAAMIAAAIVGPIIGLVKAVQTLMAAQKGMNAVQAVFNVLLAMNPIGLIITAIGILIGLFILLYNKCEPFRNAVNGLFEKFKAFGAHVIEIFTPAFEVFRGVWDKLVVTFSQIGGYISTVFGLFSQLFSKAGEGTDQFSILDFVLKGLSTVLQVVWALIGGLVETVGALFGGITDIISAFSNGGFIAGIKQIGLSLLNFVLTPIKGILKALSYIPGIGGLASAGVEKIEGFQAGLSVATQNNIAPRSNEQSSYAPAPPMTMDERLAYAGGYQDSLGISVSAEPGTRAQITRQPRSPNISLVNSGGIRGR